MSKHNHSHEEHKHDHLDEHQACVQQEEAGTAAAQPQEAPAPAEQPDYYDKFVRLSADFENFRKRTEREKAALIEYGKKDFAQKLLPAYEVMLREREKMEKDESAHQCEGEAKSLRDGMRLILGELEKIFKAEGIVRMDVKNKPYDPDTQEVVAMIPAKPEQAGLVIDEVQMGFLMDGKVLRPARVVVGQESAQ